MRLYTVLCVLQAINCSASSQAFGDDESALLQVHKSNLTKLEGKVKTKDKARRVMTSVKLMDFVWKPAGNDTFVMKKCDTSSVCNPAINDKDLPPKCFVFFQDHCGLEVLPGFDTEHLRKSMDECCTMKHGGSPEFCEELIDRFFPEHEKPVEAACDSLLDLEHVFDELREAQVEAWKRDHKTETDLMEVGEVEAVGEGEGWQSAWDWVTDTRRRAPPRRRRNHNYQQVDGARWLRCRSPHRRDDYSPWHSSSDELTADTHRREVHSAMTGEGVWKRYSWNDVPPHAGIRSHDWLKKIFDKAKNDNANCGSGHKLSGSATSNSGTDLFVAKLKDGLPYDCALGEEVDVFVGAPLNNDNNHIFSPGLNEFVVTYDKTRTTVMFWVAVGAVADSKARLYYPGCGLNTEFETTIGETFTSYSSAANPMKYFISIPSGYSSETFPKLTIKLQHLAGGQYGVFEWFCDRASTTLIDTWDVDDGIVEQFGWDIINLIGSAFGVEKVQGHIKYWSLFSVKAVQIYDLCHCYNHDSTKILNCLGENTDDQLEQVIQVVRQGLSWLQIDLASWNRIPEVLIKDPGNRNDAGTMYQCVRDWGSVIDDSGDVRITSALHKLLQEPMKDTDLVSEDQPGGQN